VTINYNYFSRYGCNLYKNKAQLSESQIFVTVTKSFLRVVFIILLTKAAVLNAYLYCSLALHLTILSLMHKILVKAVNQSKERREETIEKWLTLSTNTEKNGFGTATKLGTTNKTFVAAIKNFAAAAKRFVDRTKHFVLLIKCFCNPYFNK